MVVTALNIAHNVFFLMPPRVQMHLGEADGMQKGPTFWTGPRASASLKSWRAFLKSAAYIHISKSLMSKCEHRLEKRSYLGLAVPSQHHAGPAKRLMLHPFGWLCLLRAPYPQLPLSGNLLWHQPLFLFFFVKPQSDIKLCVTIFEQEGGARTEILIAILSVVSAVFFFLSSSVFLLCLPFCELLICFCQSVSSVCTWRSSTLSSNQLPPIHPLSPSVCSSAQLALVFSSPLRLD